MVMDIMQIIKKAFLEGYATSDISAQTIFVCICCTMLISAYIFGIYRIINRNSFYNRGFNLSLIGISVVTAAVILTIQSNIVVSLGMVGALSIVRFRTAIKDPMDLMFLFWSISVGIICGAGFALIAVVSSLGMTVVILLFSVLPGTKGNLVLVVNATAYSCEAEILRVVKKNCRYLKVRARNAGQNSLNMAIEIKVQDQAALIGALMKAEGVTSVSLVEHEGEVTV